MWLDGKIIWPFRKKSVCPNVKIFAQAGSQFCQILVSYSIKGHQVAKFSPNLVTLSGSSLSVAHQRHAWLIKKLIFKFDIRSKCQNNDVKILLQNAINLKARFNSSFLEYFTQVILDSSAITYLNINCLWNHYSEETNPNLTKNNHPCQHSCPLCQSFHQLDSKFMTTSPPELWSWQLNIGCKNCSKDFWPLTVVTNV